MEFYDRLVANTEPQRQALHDVDQLRDALRGAIDLDSYLAYLTQAYHHVRHTVPLLMAMGARLGDDKAWLHAAIGEYIKEELGHEEWILKDIAAAGGDSQRARASKPYLATELLVAYNYDYIARKNPIGFLGTVFMLESTSTQIATQGADAVRSSLGLSASAFSYLYTHGNLDLEHLAFFRRLMGRITDPEDQAALLEVAQTAFVLFAQVFRSIPHRSRVVDYVA